MSSRSNSTNIWKAITRAWQHVHTNLDWNIRDGQDTSFWKDKWIPGCDSINSYIPTTVPQSQFNFPVAFYADQNGWRWNIINQFVPEFIRVKIAVVNPPIQGQSDFCNWKLENNGQFSISSAYAWLIDQENPDASTNINPLFQIVNQWRGPARIRIHLWKLAHGYLLTNEERVRRGMTQDDLCPRCGSATENLMHLLRDCEVVQEFWNCFINPHEWSIFFSMDFYQWLKSNLSRKHMGNVPWDWSTFFGVALWSLWKDRNNFVFSQKSDMLSRFISNVAHQVHVIDKELNDPSNSLKENWNSSFKHWRKPPKGWYKANSDGAYDPKRRSSSIGGIIRDDAENFIKAFYCKLNPCNALWAELCALLQSIKFAKSLSLRQVAFEVDSSVVLDMILKGFTPIPSLQPLLEEALFYLRMRDWKIVISSTSREANACADMLANKGQSSSFSLTIVESTFHLLGTLICNDLGGSNPPS